MSHLPRLRECLQGKVVDKGQNFGAGKIFQVAGSLHCGQDKNDARYVLTNLVSNLSNIIFYPYSGLVDIHKFHLNYLSSFWGKLHFSSCYNEFHDQIVKKYLIS